MSRLQEIFNPTPEQRKKQVDFLNECIRRSVEKKGKHCSNCKYHISVQESSYYDYITCKFDRSVEIGYGMGEHSCEKYEFIGFLTAEDLL